ncbi:hypothetical protein D3C81_2182020 [compost metagenome]
MEYPLEEIQIAGSTKLFVLLVHTPGGPCMDRRVGIVETPFIGRQLAVGVHEAVFDQEQ